MSLQLIFRKRRFSKHVGLSLDRSGLRMLPPWLNTRSIGAEVAGTPKNFLAISLRIGFFRAFSFCFLCKSLTNLISKIYTIRIRITITLQTFSELQLQLELLESS